MVIAIGWLVSAMVLGFCKLTLTRRRKEKKRKKTPKIVVGGGIICGIINKIRIQCSRDYCFAFIAHEMTRTVHAVIQMMIFSRHENGN